MVYLFKMADFTLMLSHFIAVLIVSCKLSVEYLLHLQCYKVATLEHLPLPECYTCPFSADCYSYSMAVLIICFISTVEYLWHMQWCKVTKMQNVTAVEKI